MPNARVHNVVPAARRSNVVPNVRLSSRVAATTGLRFAGKGYPIGLLLVLTYTDVQRVKTPQDIFTPHVRIRNT